jgi:MATE family multidrug resistance protein
LHFKDTLKLAYPVSIGQLSHIMLGVVDSIMVGKVGAVPLAASSLVNGLVFLIVVFGLGMTLAITPLVAIARGKNDHQQSGIILRQALLINTFMGIFLSLIIYLLSELIFYLNQPQAVAIQAASYAKILGFSILPFMIFQSFRQFIDGLHYTRPAMYITLAANVVNIFGNWLFIYGHWGIPAYGLDGAGYSTLITRLFMAMVIMFYVLSSAKFKGYDPGIKIRNINWGVIRRLFEIGIPSGFQHFFEVGAFAFSAVMIGWLGSTSLAAHQIALNMASISFMGILGISAAGTIRVGNALGQENYTHLRTAGLSALLIGGMIMACFGLIFVIFRNMLPKIYIDNIEVIQIAAHLLVVAAVFQVSDGVQAVGIGILRGLTDVKIPTVISFSAYWMIGIPCGYLLGFTFNKGVIGIWIGLLTGLTVAACLLTIRFHVITKKMITPAIP